MGINFKQFFGSSSRPSGAEGTRPSGGKPSGETVDSLRAKLHQAKLAHKVAESAYLDHAYEDENHGHQSPQGAELKSGMRRAESLVRKIEKKLKKLGAQTEPGPQAEPDGFDGHAHRADSRSHTRPPGTPPPQPQAPGGGKPSGSAAHSARPTRPGVAASRGVEVGEALGGGADATYLSREAGIAGASLAGLQAIGRDVVAAARRDPALADALLAATASASIVRKARFALHPDQIARSTSLGPAARLAQLDKAEVLRNILDVAIAQRPVLAALPRSPRPAGGHLP